MKVKNIMFSGFAAAILMGVGAANAVVSTDTYNLANTGYVDAKVAAAKAHFDGKYDSEKTLTTLLADKEDVANKVEEIDLKAADGSVDLAKLGALDAQKTTYPSVSAAKAIADAVLSSVDKVSSQVGSLGTDVETLKTTVGNADSGLVKAVADNTSAITKLNSDANTEGSVAHSIAKTLDEKNYLTAVPEEYVTSEELAAEKYTTMDAVTAKGYVTAQGAKDAVATEGYLKSDALTGYAKTADLNAVSVGQTGSFIATISETNGIVSASATEFAGEVTADGAIAPTAKAVNDFVTGKGYAVAETVNNALANKLDSTALTANGTYMVTKTANGIEYTAVTVATAEDAATE